VLAREIGSGVEVLNIAHNGAAVIKFDRTGEKHVLTGQDLAAVRLGYAQHIYRMQGATVDRAIVVTGGWQASQEPAYVEASRARDGVDWYINREDLGTHGHDQNRIDRFAANLTRSSRQNPSLAHSIARDHDLGHDIGLHPPGARSHSLLPSFARSIQRLAKPPEPPGRSR
jgi:hypothetical protein